MFEGVIAQALVSFKKYIFVILSLTQLYRYTPEIFLFLTATFKYKYQVPLRRIGQEYSAKVAFFYFSVNETDTVTSGPL